MDKRVYWVHLQKCLGENAVVEGFTEKYGSAHSFYLMGPEEWKNSGIKGITRRVAERLGSVKLSESEEIVELCDKHSIHIITPEDERYPQRLLKIPNYPCVLYVRGDAESLNDRLSLAVIGSRTPCVYGENAARKIVGGLAENKITVVSGGALGVDSIAHRTALEHGTKTILVLGHGHGYKYLAENAQMRKNVCSNGAVISEYPPYTPVSAQSFPHRNRIISGMSDGVVIIEAAERSGTFSTARHALKQGRSLFVLPGDIESGNFEGSNQLITEGAKAVFSAGDILEDFGIHTEKEKILIKNNAPFVKIDVPSAEDKGAKAKKKKLSEEKKEKNEPKIENNVKFDVQGVSKNAQIVYNIMSDGANELDDITRKSSLEVRRVLTALVELEMSGAVSMTAPNKYEIKS